MTPFNSVEVLKARQHYSQNKPFNLFKFLFSVVDRGFEKRNFNYIALTKLFKQFAVYSGNTINLQSVATYHFHFRF